MNSLRLAIGPRGLPRRVEQSLVGLIGPASVRLLAKSGPRLTLLA
jgi:hypothetical protein